MCLLMEAKKKVLIGLIFNINLRDFSTGKKKPIGNPDTAWIAEGLIGFKLLALFRYIYTSFLLQASV